MPRPARLLLVAAAAASAVLAGCSSPSPAASGPATADAPADVLDLLTSGLGSVCPQWMGPDEVADNSFYARKADDVTVYEDMRYCWNEERSDFTALVYSFSSDADLEAAQDSIEGGYGGYGRAFSSSPGAEQPWLMFTGSDDWIDALQQASSAAGGVRDGR